ncbi:MAG: dihydrolipoamide acetyltransferase family protein [Thermodesulfobacteriota bacterium]
MREVFRLPDVGEGIAQAEIVEYLVQVGDQVKADQNVVRIETDKAVVELPSPFAGVVIEVPHKPGDTVNVGDPLLIVETEAKASEETPAPKAPAKPAPALEIRLAQPPAAKAATGVVTPASAATVQATPHTRRLARELGVDINTVKGSGPHGRITDEDVRKAGERVPPELPKVPTAAVVQVPATAGFDFEKYGATRRVPFKGVRKRIAEVMVRSVSTIPHVTHFDEADVTELLKVLDQARPIAESRSVKLTVLAFLVKTSAAALKKHPMVNSSLDEGTGELVIKDYINIGIATDTDAGLMVPVIRDADKKSILDIAESLQELSRKARDRTVDLEELRGGTFTITNAGAVGGMWATPIILHPQVAILGSMRATKRPVVRDDQVVIRTMMPLNLSFDHRVLDGADSGRFVNYVKELLEDPMRMLVDVP